MKAICKYKIIVLLTLFTLAVAGGARAEPDAGSERVTGPREEDQFRAYWELRNASGQAGATALDTMLKLKLSKGIDNLYTYAAALVIEAEEAEGAGKSGQVSDLLNRARDFAPDFSGADLCESRISLGRGQISNSISAYYAGSKRKMSGFIGSVPVLFNVLSVVLISLFWSLMLFAGVLMARYAKLVAHDLQERIRGFSGREALGLASAILLFPIAFLPDMAMYAFILILMLWVYMSMRERIIAAVFALFLMVIPYPIEVLGHCLAVPNEPDFRAMIRVREGVWSDEDIGVLDAARKSAADEARLADITFSLATALSYSDRFEEAEQLFRELTNKPDLAYQATLMLGNLYYRWGKYDYALKQYAVAQNILPQSFAAHFNMAAALLRPELSNLHPEYLDNADREMDKIKQLDTQRMETLTRYQHLDPGRIIEDASLPLNRLYNNLFEPSPYRKTVTQNMFSRLSGGIPLFIVPFLSVGLLAAFGILTWLSTRFDLAKLCDKCGKTYCSRCQTVAPKGNVCVRCYSAFEQTAGMDIRARERVRAEARLYMAHRGRLAQIISIILPGSGHLLMGRSARGVIFGFIAFIFILGVTYSGGIYKSQWPNPAPAVLLPLVLTIVIYVTFVAIVAWNAGDSGR